MTKLIQVIITDEARYGDGSSMDSPTRIVTKIFNPDGTLLMERDPAADVVTPEKKKFMREHLFRKLGESKEMHQLWKELCAEMESPKD